MPNTDRRLSRQLMFSASVVLVALSLLLGPRNSSGSEPPTTEVKTERIDPAGIPGALVLTGDSISDEAIESFFELAGGKKARLVLVRAFNSQDESGLVDAISAKAPEQFAELSIVSAHEANDAEHLAPLRDATGVWFIADDAAKLKTLLSSTKFGDVSRVVSQRNGVLGGAAEFAAIVSRVALNGDATEEGLGWLPDAVLDSSPGRHDGPSRVAEVLNTQPHLVGYEIGAAAALVVRGRQMRRVGDGKVVVSLAASPTRPAKQTILNDAHAALDLTALRRSARGRASGIPFPPAVPSEPNVEHGTLIIIGGGGMPRGLTERFVELAGGKEASIVIFPTANPDPLPKSDGMVNLLRRAGAREVTVLPGRTLKQVESAESLAALRTATGIWFGGGRQWRFADAYLDTQAHQLMHEVLRRGGVIGGSSAGASIQGEYLARANPLGNLDIMAEGYEHGLGFLGGVAIDQHFTQRGRQKDMSSLIAAYPQLLGIGIDETTAIVVQGHVAEVVGKHGVCFYDANKPADENKLDHEIVRDGGRYDLQARKVLDPGKQPDEPSEQ